MDFNFFICTSATCSTNIDFNNFFCCIVILHDLLNFVVEHKHLFIFKIRALKVLLLLISHKILDQGAEVEDDDGAFKLKGANEVKRIL